LARAHPDMKGTLAGGTTGAWRRSGWLRCGPGRWTPSHCGRELRAGNGIDEGPAATNGRKRAKIALSDPRRGDGHLSSAMTTRSKSITPRALATTNDRSVHAAGPAHIFLCMSSEGYVCWRGGAGAGPRGQAGRWGGGRRGEPLEPLVWRRGEVKEGSARKPAEAFAARPAPQRAPGGRARRAAPLQRTLQGGRGPRHALAAGPPPHAAAASARAAAVANLATTWRPSKVRLSMPLRALAAASTESNST